MDKRALLLTRPQDSAERFAARLPIAALSGLSVCTSPLLEIVPVGKAPDLSSFNGVIFTSAHAVGFVPSRQGVCAYCVGAQTAKAARARGWRVDLVAQTADDLVAMIREANIIGPLVHLAGTHRRGEIAERLRLNGTTMEVVTLYEQRLKRLSQEAHALLTGEVTVIVPLFSPRTAAQFVDQAGALDRAIIVAISPAVAKTIEERRVANLLIANAPTGEEMGRLVEMLLRKDRLP